MTLATTRRKISRHAIKLMPFLRGLLPSPPIRVNTATAIQFESGLSLRRSQALAIIRYREANGKFQSVEDLLKVPGIDAARVEAKRDRLIFD